MATLKQVKEFISAVGRDKVDFHEANRYLVSTNGNVQAALAKYRADKAKLQQVEDHYDQ